VRVDIELSDRTVDVIGDGFDMALRIGTLSDSTLIAQQLAEIRMIACCSPHYRRADGLPGTPEELARHACLLYGQEGLTGWTLTVDGEKRAFEVSGPLRADNGEVIRDAAIAGLGIALLPEFIVSAAIASGALVEVLSEFAAPSLALYAIYPQHRERSITVRSFTQFLRQRFARGLGQQ